MARAKKSMTVAKPEHAEPVHPMPFPGESPTVSLAMAAAQMYGLHEEDEKPTRSSAKRKTSATKKTARAGRKANKPARTAKSKKPARSTKGGGKGRRAAAHA